MTETTDADLLAMASAFDLIPFNPRGRSGTIRELKVERRQTNPDAWAIVCEGNALARDGFWVIEPRPSSRDDEFFAQCRWSSARDAIAFAQEHMAKHPTGYTPEHRALWSKAPFAGCGHD